MRWTFKRFAIWLAAFLFTSFGSMTLHGTPGVIFSVLQFAVAMFLGWPLVLAGLSFLSLGAGSRSVSKEQAEAAEYFTLYANRDSDRRRD